MQVKEKTGLRIEQPDTRGGPTSTGSVARGASSYEFSYSESVLTVVRTSGVSRGGRGGATAPLFFSLPPICPPTFFRIYT